jgi:hypothetical protein
MSANQHSDLKLHLHHAPVEIERKFLTMRGNTA